MEVQLPDESLEAFRAYIDQLLSVNITDPNVSVTFTGDALGAIGSYAAGRLPWKEFASRCRSLLTPYQAER